MEFDIRSHGYTFKHSFSPKPDLSAERFKEHYHTTYEFLYFVQGDADFMVKHTHYKIRPGSLLIVKPGEYHNIVFNSDKPYDRYVIRFSHQALPPIIRKHLQKVEAVYYIDGTPLAQEFYRVDELVGSIHPEVCLYACIGSINIIISHLISSQNLIQKADYINEESRKIVEYIDSHLSEIRSAQDVATALHMSKSSIYKIFTEQFHTSLMHYVRIQKCVAAKVLLEDGVPAIDTSNRLGFNNYSSFYRNYVRVFNEPPSSGKG